jgi:RNA polymerase sigma-70 factor (ECF subfamily)
MNKLDLFNKDYDLELRNKLYRIALKACGNLYADDVVQKASVIMWEKYDTYNQGTSFFNWANKIMSNVMSNLFRSINRNVVLQDHDKFELVAEKTTHESNSTPQAVDDKLEQAMIQLNHAEIELLNAVYIQGKGIKEWAIENGKAPQTVFNKINSIKKKINEQCRSSKSL